MRRSNSRGMAPKRQGRRRKERGTTHEGGTRHRLMWKMRDSSAGVSIMVSALRMLVKDACNIANAGLKMLIGYRRKPAPGTLPALIEASARSRRAQKTPAV